MTGHIRKRGVGSYELKFDAGTDPVTGKRRTRYASFKGTKREAQAELDRLVGEFRAGNAIDPSRETVADFFDRWDRDFASTKVSPKTLERYRQLIALQIKPHIGHVAIQKLKPVHLADLYAKLLREGRAPGRGLAPRTVGHVHRLIHRALRHAAAWGVVSQNVAAHVEPPSVQEEEITILSQEQVGTVLRHFEGRTMHPILNVMLATGVRRGEVLALRWRDVDLEKATIRVERSLEQTKAGLRFKAPKTRHGRRTVSIPAYIVADLKAHQAKQNRRRLSLGMGRAPANSLVFARWDGGTRAPNGLTQKFALAMAALKIKGVTLHALRHTHASQLIAAGMDVLTISRRLGHGSPVITLKVYGHLFGSADARAAEIMDAAFAAHRPQ